VQVILEVTANMWQVDDAGLGHGGRGDLDQIATAPNKENR
jgi:hypothetical protein